MCSVYQISILKMRNIYDLTETYMNMSNIYQKPKNMNLYEHVQYKNIYQKFL